MREMISQHLEAIKVNPNLDFKKWLVKYQYDNNIIFASRNNFETVHFLTYHNFRKK